MVLTARRGCVLTLLWALGSVLGACATVPSFASTHDAGDHCSTTSPCPSGQTCLQGTCYAPCDATHACSARETCTMGVCMRSTSDAGLPPHDAGNDGGFCGMTTCMTPTPVCRGDLGRCTQCSAMNRDECDALAASPTCDVGRLACAARVSAVCAPCNVTADCPAGLACVTRTAPDPVERVCLPPCSGTVACTTPGFTCTASQCLPFFGSCTAYRAAVTAHPCTMDSDCPQLGATVDDGLVPNMCFGPAAGGPRTCHIACVAASDCATGQMCLLPPTGGTIHFCQ